MATPDDRARRVRQQLAGGVVIPAHPLALNAKRRLDERRQRALTRYYLAAGAGGVAVGVHTTQFSIRDPKHALLGTVLELARDEVLRAERAATAASPPVALIAGICGATAQAVSEAQLARDLGYDAGLVSLAALSGANDEALVAHCRAVADVIPVFGFYLQPAVGGRVLGYGFWRRFAEIEGVWAVKVAPFNRYWTFDVVRALADAGRDDVALYTGNDDNIVVDLVTPMPVAAGSTNVRSFAGGLLGQWAVWTRAAVDLLARCKTARDSQCVETALLQEGAALTDANGALFDVAHGFAGCIPGIHEALRRCGLLEGTWCLDPAEVLSPGQREEIDRVCLAYPFLRDDAFVAEHRDEWLR